MITDDEIKEILSPHLGYLSLLKKFVKNDTDNLITKSDLEHLKSFLSKKEMVKLMTANIFSYKSYYNLIIDLYNCNKKYTAVKFIKDNVVSNKRDIYLESLNDIVVKKIHVILSDEKKKENFKRYSSRVVSNIEIDNYLDSIIQDDFYLFENDIIKLDTFEKASKYSPMSWCIKSSIINYNNYTMNNDIYIVKYNGRVYGLNYFKSGMFNYISDDKNATVYNVNLDYFKDIINGYYNPEKRDCSTGDTKVGNDSEVKKKNKIKYKMPFFKS